MLKLPEKKYVPKHNLNLKAYAIGWNSVIDHASRKCSDYTDNIARIYLADLKEAIYDCIKLVPFYEGQYDCILEIEKLNEEKEEPKIPVGGFVMVKDKYICFDEDYTCPLFNRDKWKCQYCINTKTDKCPLLLP